MVKDSTNGIAGGLVSSIAKPFKMDKDSKKEAAEKEKIETKEKTAGDAEKSRHSEILKALKDLKDSLKERPSTTKLDRESAKEIGKAVADNLKRSGGTTP